MQTIGTGENVIHVKRSATSNGVLLSIRAARELAAELNSIVRQSAAAKRSAK